MAHMIETMAYAGATPWHGLGNLVLPNISIDEMTIQAGLDWTVEKKKIQVCGGKTITGRYALVRNSTDPEKNGTIMGLCADKYKPVQNVDSLGFFREFVEAGNMTLETAGSLSEGQRIWALARMNNGKFSVGNSNDESDSFVLLCQSHKPGAAMVIAPTTVRVVCNNTVRMALQEIGQSGFRMTHGRHFDDTAKQEAKDLIGLTVRHIGKFKESAEFLASKQVTDSALDTYFKTLFQPQGFIPKANASNDANRVVNAVKLAYNVQPGKELNDNTFWTAFNAVTYYLDHHAGRNQDTRLNASWFGAAATKKIQALKLAETMARAA